MAELKTAATEIEDVQRRARALAEDISGKGIDDKAAAFFRGDQAGGSEGAQVMGNVGDGGVEGAGNLADGFGALLEALDDLQAVWIGDRFEVLGTFL